MLSPEAVIVAGAAGMSAAGALFAALAASRARALADWFVLLAGVVLSLGVLTHLAPEALSLRPDGWAFICLGAAFGGLAELLVQRRREKMADPARLGAWVSLGALMLHSTLDGAAYSASFGHSEVSGIVAGTGLILHEAPEGVAAMLLALQTGLRSSIAPLAALAASAATTPLGWALAHGLGERAHGSMEIMFALSAGLLTYVGLRLLVSGWRAVRART
jgi:zinc transporter ZupT